MPPNNTRQTQPDSRVTKLRQQWDRSRKHSRRVAADARKVRRQSRELVKQWRLILAQSKEMHRARGQSPDTPAAPVNVFVATARRVPWRRVQMEDIDGPISVWHAPGYEEI